MRWRFCPSVNDPDFDERHRARSAMARLWTEFAARKDDVASVVRGGPRWDFAGWLTPLIEAVHPDLEWEICPGEDDGHGLALSAAADRSLQPLIDAMLAEAPRFDEWTLYPARRALPADFVRHAVSSRLRRPFDEIWFRLERGCHNAIALQAVARSFSGRDREADLIAAALYACAVLGEQRFWRWIKGFTTGPLERDRRETGWVTLDDLAESVTTMAENIRATLPDGYTLPRESQMSAFKLEPASPDDDTGFADLSVATTPYPDLWRAAHSGTFSSERFSRTGEIFSYLKIDGREGLPAHWEDRGSVEDELNDVLERNRLGSVLSGGTGHVHSYIELAVRDVDAAATVVTEILRRGGINKRTWMLWPLHYGLGRLRWFSRFSSSVSPLASQIEQDSKALGWG